MPNPTADPLPGVAALVMEEAVMEALVMELVVAVMAPCRHPSVSWLPLEPPTLPPPPLFLLLP